MKVKQSKREAFVIGASGATGTELLQLMVNDKSYSTIHVPHRKTLKVESAKIKTYEFEKIYEPWEIKAQVDDLFYCFGSTQDKAGGKDAFADLEIKVAHQVLWLAKELKVKNFYLVSAKGIKPHLLKGYFKVKAEVEKIIKDHQFNSLYIYRPSLLLTNRDERRVLEFMAQKISAPVAPWWQRYWPGNAPVRVDQLAKTMLYDAQHSENGIHIRENKNILELSLLYQS